MSRDIPEGYYWVRMDGAVSVAKRYDSGWWATIGYDGPVRDADIDEVIERVREPT